MPWYRRVQFVALAVALVAVSWMGWELFVNDIDNLAVIKICGYTALIALHVNLFAPIYRLVEERKKK